MKRLISMSVLIGLLVALMLAACGPAATPEPTATPVPPTATAAPPRPAPFPITVTDGLGREVTLEAAPGRVISLAPANTEILFAVGAGDQVVGVTEYCNYPPEAQEREQIGGFSAKTISVEAVVALEPDLVFSVGEIHQPVIEALEGVGIPVVALPATTFDDVYANLELVGRLTGHEEEAGQVVATMKARVEAVEVVVAGIPQEERPAVFWEVWDEPLMTAGPATFMGQVIEMAGGVNIFGDVTEDYPQISVEGVVDRNPALILGPDTHGDKLTAEQVSERPGWGEIDAVREGRIHLIDGDIVSRAGPRLADGLEAIVKVLYPERFE